MTWTSLRNPAVIIFCAMMAIGCASHQLQEVSRIEMTLQVTPNPPQIGPSRIMVVLIDEYGEPIDDANVGLTAFHTGAKPVTVSLSRSGAGHYEGPFTWTAAGRWRVSLSVGLIGGHKISRIFGVRVKGGLDDEDMRLAGFQ